MSIFDPNDNFNDWIQNDWESDDYIENHKTEGKQKMQQNYESNSTFDMVIHALEVFGAIFSGTWWILLIILIMIIK